MTLKKTNIHKYYLISNKHFAKIGLNREFQGIQELMNKKYYDSVYINNESNC